MRLLLPLFVLSITSCLPATAVSPADFRRSVAGADWELVELQGRPAALGAGGRRATLRFDTDTSRVSGFAGCNRYFGSYVLGDAEPGLSFGDIGMTKMACSQGMDLERALADVLMQTSRYSLQQERLTLLNAAGPLAVFARAPR